MKPTPLFDANDTFVPFDERVVNQAWLEARAKWPNHDLVEVSRIEDPRPVFVPGILLEDRPS